MCFVRTQEECSLFQGTRRTLRLSWRAILASDRLRSTVVGGVTVPPARSAGLCGSLGHGTLWKSLFLAPSHTCACPPEQARNNRTVHLAVICTPFIRCYDDRRRSTDGFKHMSKKLEHAPFVVTAKVKASNWLTPAICSTLTTSMSVGTRNTAVRSFSYPPADVWSRVQCKSSP